MEILPSDLKTYGRDAKALLKELQSQNERMFLVTILVLNTGRTEQELETNVFQASSIAQKHNCNLCRLDFQQEQGLMSSLPLADCQVEIQRGLTTSSTAIFVPFTTQELYQSGRESLYYGLNALSNNLIMVDRKRLKNPNGLILGTPGSGKSFSAKREITNAFLVTDDDIIVCDPEAEYAPLVERLHGQVIRISPASTQYINPLDINSNYSEEDNPLALKADFILSLCELVVGGKEGLLPVEKTVIGRCVHLIYRKYFADPAPENMPLLEDLYNALLQQDEKEAHHVAAALEIYVKGSLNVFNHRTNVDINNRIVCFDIKQLGKQLKKLGMLIVQDAVWGRVTANRSAGKSTRYYVDEFHLLLKEAQTAAYSIEIWKRFRKWGGQPKKLRMEEGRTDTATRSPPKKSRATQTIPKKKKLKSEAEKVKEKAAKLRLGKVEITPEEVSRMTKAQKRELYAAAAARSAAHREVEQYEDDNVGAQALNEGEKTAEGAGHYTRSRYARRLKKKAKLQAGKKKTRTEKTAASDESKRTSTAEGEVHWFSRWKQRQEIRKSYYAAAQSGGTAAQATGSSKAASGSASAARSGVEQVADKGRSAASAAVNGIENYEILYRGNLPTGKRSVPQPELLEQLYQKFNCAQPMDYHGHSLSVSDVILLNQAGKISAHYVDSIGFRELSGFQDKQERSSVLSQLKAKCDMPECNPTKCRKGRNDHAI